MNESLTHPSHSSLTTQPAAEALPPARACRLRDRHSHRLWPDHCYIAGAPDGDPSFADVLQCDADDLVAGPACGFSVSRRVVDGHQTNLVTLASIGDPQLLQGSALQDNVENLPTDGAAHGALRHPKRDT